MNGVLAEIDSPTKLASMLFGQLDERGREAFLTEFLLRQFRGEAGALTLFEEPDRTSALFHIRSAGPVLEELLIDDENLNEEAMEAVQKYCR